MRIALLLTVLCAVQLTAQAFSMPNMHDLRNAEEALRKTLENTKKSLSNFLHGAPSLKKMIEDARKKLKNPNLMGEIENRMEHASSLHLAKWTRIVETHGAKIHNHGAFEELMHHMFDGHARIHLEKAKSILKAAHNVATTIYGTKSSETLPLTSSLSGFADRHLKLILDGVHIILKKHGIKICMHKIYEMVSAATDAVMKGESPSQVVITALKKVKPTLNEAQLRTDVNALVSKVKTSVDKGIANMMISHNMNPIGKDQMKAIMKKEISVVRNFKNVHALKSSEMKMIHTLASQAFGKLQPTSMKSLMEKLRFTILPSLQAQMMEIGQLFKKRNIHMDHNMMVIAIYSHMLQRHDREHDGPEGHKAWKKPLMIAAIGFGCITVMALVVTGTYCCLQQKRRSHHASSNETALPEKSSLPYAIMADDSSSCAKA